MSEDKLNRRQFIERAAAIGAATVGVGTVISGCEPPDQDGGGQEGQGGGTEDQAGGASCNDDQALADLEQSDIDQRNQHSYTDSSPEQNQVCDNCLHWEPEGTDVEGCGGCAVLPGPVHADGWCELWAEAG